MESARLQIARVFGIPVYIHASWLIIFGLITWTLAIGYFPARYPDLPAASYWARGLITSLLFFVSIFLHEMSHALVPAVPGALRRRYSIDCNARRSVAALSSSARASSSASAA